MQQIPLQAVPSQQLQTVLNNQNCQIAIYVKEQGMFVDLNSNGVDISIAVLALNLTPLTLNYSGFVGNLLFVNTQGVTDPVYTGLGTRYSLVYLDAAEYALI